MTYFLNDRRSHSILLVFCSRLQKMTTQISPESTVHMRSRNMDARNKAMEAESGEQDYEPLSKRSRLNLDGQEASSSSKLSNESRDTGKYF